jgi:hypothetical protein
MTHSGEYLQWVAYVLSAVGGLRFLPLAVVRLTAAFTGNEARHRQCLEVIRLARRDAAQIPTYVSTQSNRAEAKAATRPRTPGKAVSSGDGGLARRSAA